MLSKVIEAFSLGAAAQLIKPYKKGTVLKKTRELTEE